LKFWVIHQKDCFEQPPIKINSTNPNPNPCPNVIQPLFHQNPILKKYSKTVPEQHPNKTRTKPPVFRAKVTNGYIWLQLVSFGFIWFQLVSIGSTTLFISHLVAKLAA
jgi:hypothetical protein